MIRIYRDGELDDSELLGGDVLEFGAEPLLVVEADGHEHSDVGVDDIGGVPPAAHADLDDGHIHGRRGEGLVGHDDEDLQAFRQTFYK